jgi:hypothetical protein
MDQSASGLEPDPRSERGLGDEPGSHSAPGHLRPSSSLAKRWWLRVADGEHGWGSIDVGRSSHGFRNYRLVVFPPGISQAERRCVRLWRAWPTWGALLWLMVMICSGSVLGPWAALAISATAYLAAGAILRARAGKVCSQVRALRVAQIQGHADARWTAQYELLEMLVGVLGRADARRAQGQLSIVDHEMVWWNVYDRLGSNAQRA